MFRSIQNQVHWLERSRASGTGSSHPRKEVTAIFKRKAAADLTQLAYEQLLARRNEIEAEINARGTLELDALKDRLRAIAEAQGVTLAELFAQRKPRKAATPKYRNPEDPSEVWSGRGKPPRWLKEKLDAGAQLAEFEAR